MKEDADIREALLDVAKRCVDQGPGFAQQSVVLRQAAEQLGIPRDLKEQQRVLNVWYDLFKDGTLYWGYDISNSGQPFFHFPERQAS
jgi:hypothetical protein